MTIERLRPLYRLRDEIATRAYVAGDRVTAAKLRSLRSLALPGGVAEWMLAAKRLPLPTEDAEALIVAIAEDHSERIARATCDS